ncbi:HupE/UreJ family protein [Novosphingobium sp. 2580]|uniref:HupE/UreJ family protein n=2 Tax=Novosphingobium album (ex Hu et al. 2023) TaxID=2930093 RepID=A0ABT0B7J7_9SPHN|nr:HupE/UreJ family protein [Novosphingobium album (ex Hu et al. 2023)]MCJ2180988.1 HupE/UreJ family protein [Novosphingobium album (ex Hu et al. 2023)]
MAHGVAESDKAYIQAHPGANIIPYTYLGAKHMVTGYDHLLFLFGVIFFLYRLKDIWSYVTLFALGHSTTLIAGVMFNIHANPFIIDAIIGLSVVYKALDNLGAFPTLLGFQPNQKAAVLIFGFFHGFGLATKLQDLIASRDGLFANLVSFNVGVEMGQVIALSIILIAMTFWRRSNSFARSAVAANAILMSAGFILTGYQIAGFFTEQTV